MQEAQTVSGSADRTNSILLEVQSSFAGHTNVYIEDAHTAAGRDKLAKTVDDMIKKGHSVFLVEAGEIKSSRRVERYDAKTHEWVLRKRKGETAKTETRVPATEAKATVVPAGAGG